MGWSQTLERQLRGRGVFGMTRATQEAHCHPWISFRAQRQPGELDTPINATEPAGWPGGSVGWLCGSERLNSMHEVLQQLKARCLSTRNPGPRHIGRTISHAKPSVRD